VLKWGYSSDPENCDCGTRSTMQHLLNHKLMESACSAFDLMMANDIDIGSWQKDTKE